MYAFSETDLKKKTVLKAFFKNKQNKIKLGKFNQNLAQKAKTMSYLALLIKQVVD